LEVILEAVKLSHVYLNGFGENMSPASMAGLTLDIAKRLGFYETASIVGHKPIA
jgi:hypothetical protein